MRIPVVTFVAGLALSLLPSLPAAAAETGTIRGKVINQTTGKAQPGVRVILSSGGSGQDETSTTELVTDMKGRYLFEDLATGSDRFYAVDAIFDGGVFSGGAITIPDDTSEPPVIDSTLKVWNTTTDPAVVVISRDDVFVSPSDDGGVGVVESVRLANTSDLAYVGRGADDPGAQPGSVATVGFALPGDANERQVSIVDSDIDIPALLPTEYGFAITVALPPGMTQITFSYPIEGLTGSYDLSRRALYPVLGLEVYAAPPLELRSNRLTLSDQVEVGDESYEHYVADGDLDAGDPVQILAIAEAGSSTALIAGLATLLGLLVIGAAIGLLRARRSKSEEPLERDDLVRAIAAIDHAHDRGQLGTDEWAARRAELKSDLASRDDDKVSR